MTPKKTTLHPRNAHAQPYDFPKLIAVCPELAPFVKLNPYGKESVDFFDPMAVKTLNRALIKLVYGIDRWDVPAGYLCPPIPGRADYVHYMADVLASVQDGQVPTGAQVRCLDIGTGANAIYPLLGASIYKWSFVGTDIDPIAIASAKRILAHNPKFQNKIEIRLQPSKQDIFKGVILPKDHFDLVFCNPPFHASKEEAMAGTLRKLSHLKGTPIAEPLLNFGGQNNELWCEGGEVGFLRRMITQSVAYAQNCTWFSSLVSKESSLKPINEALKKVNASDVQTIQMTQGNKVSRVVVWRF